MAVSKSAMAHLEAAWCDHPICEGCDGDDFPAFEYGECDQCHDHPFCPRCLIHSMDDLIGYECPGCRSS